MKKVTSFLLIVFALSATQALANVTHQFVADPSQCKGACKAATGKKNSYMGKVEKSTEMLPQKPYKCYCHK